MIDTVRPDSLTTKPPSSQGAPCAYADLLAKVRAAAPRVGVALAAAMACEDYGPDAQAALAPRLWEVVRHEAQTSAA
jgi:hypothetical protein